MRRYVRFTENNEWEGETWHFYIPVDAPELPIIETLLEDNPEKFGFYTLGDKIFTEEEVDSLVDSSDEGYYAMHNKVVSIHLEEYDSSMNWEDYDPFYKGTAFEF